jgi:hypothetical protein
MGVDSSRNYRETGKRLECAKLAMEIVQCVAGTQIIRISKQVNEKAGLGMPSQAITYNSMQKRVILYLPL